MSDYNDFLEDDEDLEHYGKGLRPKKFDDKSWKGKGRAKKQVKQEVEKRNQRKHRDDINWDN